MYTLWRDCRFAGRQLSRSLGFTITTVLTLALGIGATTAIFSLVHAVLLQPLPFPHAGDLMWVQQQDHATNLAEDLSYPTFFDWRARSKAFSGLTAYHTNTMSLTGVGAAQQISGAVVSAEFFRVLGARPLLGRDFLPQEEKPGNRIVMLSYRLWRTEFNGAKDAAGRTVRLNGDLYQIVGVMPRSFGFPITSPAPLFWTTLAVDAEGKDPATGQRGFDQLDVIGRLKSGVSVAQAHNEMNLIAQHLALQYPDTNANFTSTIVRPELDHLVGEYRPALRVLFAAVISLLLIACVNVAGLLLARMSQRRGEMAVRAALGASRVEITRQVLVESVMLALGGGAVGVLLAQLVLKTMLRLAPERLPRSGEVTIDGLVLGFAVATAIATGLLFGFLPAWRASKADPSLALQAGSRTVAGTRGEHRMQSALVILETAISLALLIGAGLLIHSFVRVLQVDPGFDAQHILTALPGGISRVPTSPMEGR
ncbi:MAG: ABC transporter permease [Acidobacteriaceae bacterium]